MLMKKSDSFFPAPSQIKPDVPFGEQTVDLGEVLGMCAYIGELLRCVPKYERKYAIARLFQKSHQLNNEGYPLGAMMLALVSNSWEDYPHGPCCRSQDIEPNKLGITGVD